MQNKLVSVIIPCYNSGSTITQTVKSVHLQDWDDVEIIVVDDGSTDLETISVLNNIKNIKLIRQGNRGLPAARNAGIQASNGRYILPLDADDWLEPNAITELQSALTNNPRASFTCSYWQLHGDSSGVLEKEYNFFEQLFLNQIPYCIFYPKEIWMSIGGYDETMKKGYEDWEFNIRLGSYGYFGHVVRRPLFHYRITSNGMLQSKSNRIHGELWDEIQEKHSKLYHPLRLLKLWSHWSKKQSTYPSFIYFGWLALHKILPNWLFDKIFLRLRKLSQSRRISTKSSPS